MAASKGYTVMFRRKRIKKTDYKHRLKLLVSRRNRLVIRKSSKYIYLQLVKYDKKGDAVLSGISSKKLKEYGWSYQLNNLPSSYLIGLNFGLELIKQKINDAIVDFGLNASVYGSSFYSALKGLADSGLNIPYDKKVIPNEERISGKHILSYNLLLKNNPEKYEKQFSWYIKNKINPENIVDDFKKTREKIINKYKND